MTAQIILAKGKEKALKRRHPWIFSGAVSKVKGEATAGDTVDIMSAGGEWLASGSYSPESQIRVRVWHYDRGVEIDQAFFEKRIKQAQSLRDELIEEKGLTGYRLIAAESDSLPGITIDRYNDFLVCQLLSAGADFHRDTLVAALSVLYPECSIYERSDVAVRKKEGLELVQGVLKGEEPPEVVIIEENGVKIEVDIKGGHKTGFYLDQRDNRKAAAKYAKGKDVLNCFSYTGGFGVYALQAGAKSITNVDLSQPALDIAKRNAEHNNLDLSNASFERADVFKLLRKFREEGRTFDTIILDPPKFAENKAQMKGACRGYKDINFVAMQVLKPGGTLLTFSCSGLMEDGLFQKIVADAALDAGRDAYIVERLSQAGDHPTASFYPEGYYLNGLVLKVL
ncbi:MULTISPECIES: class I SAM-dependent methyltransferase [unclassified Moritella]|uniref:class I SAM-dependent methyltransferase n=1 Tax=unclassified Moritella TaxID=2637987 RepID=UPI001BAA376E|nr:MULTISPECIES: class I SAM-dependent methyltransferase [unclassified Moritella]QUM84857.1 class I SAM-dependent methyltransferase [Moritella sp. 28]QUM89100.1 class I SAM-dependent methyltransferase [Moritella sp. 36]